MPKACHGRSLDEVVGLLAERASAEMHRIDSVLGEARLKASATMYHGTVLRSLDADTDDWKALVPGKSLLAQFAAAAGMQTSRMKTLYLNAARDQDPNPFAEIDSTFAAFSAM